MSGGSSDGGVAASGRGGAAGGRGGSSESGTGAFESGSAGAPETGEAGVSAGGRAGRPSFGDGGTSEAGDSAGGNSTGGALVNHGGAGDGAGGGCAGAARYELLADADAWITEADPKATLGLEMDLFIGSLVGEEARALVHFDLSEVPADASIESATLELELRASAGEAREVGAYALQEAWDERRVSWLVAGRGVNWAPPGGDTSSAPTDMSLIPLGTPVGTRASWDLAADVGGALSAESAEIGWLLVESKPGRSGLAFAARETPDRAPRLIIVTCPP